MPQSELALLRRSAIVSYAIGISGIVDSIGNCLLWFWIFGYYFAQGPGGMPFPLSASYCAQTISALFPWIAAATLIAFALSFYFAYKCFQLGGLYQLRSMKLAGTATIVGQVGSVIILVAYLQAYSQYLSGIASGYAYQQGFLAGYGLAYTILCQSSIACLIMLAVGLRGLRNFTEKRIFATVMMLAILGILIPWPGLAWEVAVGPTIQIIPALGYAWFSPVFAMLITIMALGFGLSRLAKQGGAKKAIVG